MELRVMEERWGRVKSGAFSSYDPDVLPNLLEGEIPAGVYRAATDGDGRLWFMPKQIVTDEIVQLPGCPSAKVLSDMYRFWGSEDRYRRHGVIHKRGVLLEGPPGSGKTVTLDRVAAAMVERNGIVLLSEDITDTGRALRDIRRLEPERAIVVVIEDIEAYAGNRMEPYLLSLMDGEDQVGGVVFLATTNYIERLPARLINRPSRFDVIIHVGFPEKEARRAYMDHFLRNSPTEAVEIDLPKWATDTKGFAVAHLKELMVAVICLGQPYAEVLTRLRKMSAPKE